MWNPRPTPSVPPQHAVNHPSKMGLGAKLALVPVRVAVCAAALGLIPAMAMKVETFQIDDIKSWGFTARAKTRWADSGGHRACVRRRWRRRQRSRTEAWLCAAANKSTKKDH